MKLNFAREETLRLAGKTLSREASAIGLSVTEVRSAKRLG